ncbi:MAG: lysine--tRNA ligase [Planctomycetes bacterium]|nr:lysine--tRNA ligase [Planctomycetota bacterium]
MSSEFDERVRRAGQIGALGSSPWGNRFDGAQPIGPVASSFGVETEGKSFTVAGRVTAHRSFGKAVFLDVRDRTGKVQVYARQDALRSSWELFKHVGIADWIGVTGTLGKTRTGEITLFATEIALLTKALRPLPEKWHGLQDPELRHRRRYLDLIANPKVLETFQKRSRMLSEMRRFLDARGYLEVETPVMHSIAGGAAARPFVTHHNALDRDFFLRIALEIPLKKLLVGGFEKVYEIGRVFRNEGIDTRHNPEFTMLELYHALGDLRTMMELCEGLVVHLAKEIAGGLTLPYGEKVIDLAPPWPRKEFYDLLREHGFDPADQEQLRTELRKRGIDPAKMDAWEVLDEIFGEVVQPQIVNPVFVTAQPIEMTPLCRRIDGRPAHADRFEAYVAGMEISNAYTELNDPIEQRARLEEQAAGDASKTDHDFLRAMEHGMPPAGGIGVGIDRLAMILTNNPSIREVILFPLLREADSGAEE